MFRPPVLALKWAALAVLIPVLHGCYLARSAWEEARILAARRPMAELVADRSIPDSTRRKLRLVLAAREFARDSLGLVPGESFTTFSDIGRDTLVLVLSAARRDSLVAHIWKYPVVGRLPYRGFFDLSDATGAAGDLEREGYDTYLRTSDAFSTLGWFNDPLLSTTLRRDSLSLVNTVFHELTHNTYFAKGQAGFNESFATFVGARAAELFFRSRGAPEAAAKADAEWRDDKLLSVFWAGLARSIDSAFAAHPGAGNRTRRLLARDTVYARARRRLVDEVGVQLRTIGPAYAQRVPLNNAYLMARAVYGTDLQLFDEVYFLEERKLKPALGRIIGLAKTKPEDPYGAVREWVRAAEQRL